MRSQNVRTVSSTEILMAFTLASVCLGVVSCKSVQQRPHGVPTGVNSELSALTNAVEIQIQMQGTKLCDVTLENEQGKKTSLKALVGQATKLIFAFGELTCRVCVEKELENLKVWNYQKDVLILSSYSNRRDLYLFKRVNRIEGSVYNLDGRSLGIPADESHGVFLLVVDSALVVRACLVPLKEFPSFSELFYKVLVPRYIKQLDR